MRTSWHRNEKWDVTLARDTKTHLSFSYYFLLRSILDVREWCLHGVWRSVPTVPAHLLHFHLLPHHRGLCLTLAGSGHAQVWGWACRVGRAAGPTWSCAGGCACTGSRASLRGRTNLFSRPCEPRGISWAWLCARTEGWRGVPRSPHSGTAQRGKKIKVNEGRTEAFKVRKAKQERHEMLLKQR